MAISEQAGFSTRGGAALPTDLGQALSAQLDRVFSKLCGGAVARRPEMLSGVTFEQLSPGLAHEIGAGRRL